MNKSCLFLSVALMFSAHVFADQYPDMVGVWKGHIRAVSSGESLSDQVAKNGAVLSELDLTFTIEYQNGETFIGKSRSSTTPRGQASTPVWGAIRSNGKEAQFIAGNGGRGNLWFADGDQFEFCLTNLAEKIISAYCGILKKE